MANKNAFSKKCIPSSEFRFSGQGAGTSRKRKTGSNFKKVKKIGFSEKFRTTVRKMFGPGSIKT